MNNPEVVKKSNKGLIAFIIIFCILCLLAIFYFLFGKSLFKKEEKKEPVSNDTNVVETASPYKIKSNNLEMFDLRFLQLENEEENKVYSPLSIKTALSMLNEGTDKESKKQIADIIGDYQAKKYVNSANMSFANALFVQNAYQNNIKENYLNTLKNKYNAQVVYDSFQTPNNINAWVKNNTFNLIDDLFDDVQNYNFILTNALAIDMEWVNKIQSEHDDYVVDFAHEKYDYYLPSLDSFGYHTLKFNNDHNAKSALIAGVANRYDLVNTLGEDNIRNEVGAAYSTWLEKEECGPASEQPDVNTYLDQYIKDLNSNYQNISSSTDFAFYDDEEVQVFAKDLKEYNNVTLEYVGIMPKNISLKNYISTIDADKINNIIANLKNIELNSFKDGVITQINGVIPMFQFAYELKLQEDLNSLGITDVFDAQKANLTKITNDEKAYINKASHKAQIEFSNDGIKAGAATALGDKGSADCSFRYDYDVPVEKIDLTFDKPYLFFIIDKDTKEVWFTGTVYEPIKWSDDMNY